MEIEEIQNKIQIQKQSYQYCRVQLAAPFYLQTVWMGNLRTFFDLTYHFYYQIVKYKIEICLITSVPIVLEAHFSSEWWHIIGAPFSPHLLQGTFSNETGTLFKRNDLSRWMQCAYCRIIHCNLVKHGFVRCAIDYPWSSSHRSIDEGLYERGEFTRIILVIWGKDKNER